MQMMGMMMKMFETSLAETRAMVLDLVQGRATPPSGPQVIDLTSNESSMSYNYDDTPLHPGIEAIEQREREERQETLQARLLRERAALQAQLMEVDARRQALELSDSSGPWTDQENQEPITSS